MGRHLDQIEAIAALNGGTVIGLPTESSFALGARIDRPAALERLGDLKAGRSDPIGLMIGHPRQLPGHVTEVPAIGFDLARAYWPGPLTIVLEATANVPDLVTAGRKSVGFRVPGYPPLVDLLLAVGAPVTATSANPPGEPPATTVAAFETYFPDLDIWTPVMETPGGPPSTLVDIRDGGLTVLRHGAAEI